MFNERANELVADFKFKNFADALDFVNKVGELSEQANHHPDITFGWGYVKVSLTSHSAGDKVTDKDHQLAEEIQNAYQEKG